jgi:hypothetical protein
MQRRGWRRWRALLERNNTLIMKYQYSIAICPPIKTIRLIRQLKLDLRNTLNTWYKSVNSEAHFSLFDFFDDGVRLGVMEKFLAEFCKDITPFPVTVDRAGRLNTTYCLFPDKRSNKILVELMKQFQTRKPFSKRHACPAPHLSIGRELSEEQLGMAETLFGNRLIMEEFQCTDLVIRRRIFESNDQYEVHKRFAFSNKPLLLFSFLLQ